MPVQLAFHGAAETVTGSKYLVTADGASVLVDCGMFQGLKELRLRNWRDFPFEPRDVDAVVLTHAHIDHLGMLPRLVASGFNRTVHATPATVELAELMLYDSAKNQIEDAQYVNRKKASKHHPALPLYTDRDVDRTLRLLAPRPRGQWFEVAGPIRARFHDAGHLLGSAMVEMEIARPNRPLRLLFSGDVGRYGGALYHDPAPPPECDYLVCESTYGNRDHVSQLAIDELCEVTLEAIRRGGVLLIPSFAVGRAQQIIYLLQVLIHRQKLPELPIYLDSPMAVDASRIFASYAADHDLSEALLTGPKKALSGRNVHLSRSVEESKRINSVEGPAVIISSSGMLIGGRILHHLAQRLGDSRNTILLPGYMAEGTRGRSLQQGTKYLRIHGRDLPVRAAVATISGLSGHAGRSELLRWLTPLPAPKRTFITHGEKQSAHDFAETLRTERGWDVVVPHMDQAFALEDSA